MSRTDSLSSTPTLPLDTVSILRTIREGLFGLLYTASKGADDSWRGALLLFLVQFMQGMSFLFPVAFDVSAGLHAVFGWSNLTSWLSYFVAGAMVVPYVTLTETGMMIAWVLAVLAVLSVFIVTLVVVLRYSVPLFKFFTITRVLRQCSEFLYGPLYMPLMTLICRWFVCLDSTNGTIGCWTNSHLILLVISAIVAVIYFISGLFFVCTYYSRDPVACSLTARPHSRVQIWQFLIYSLYSVTVVFSWQSTRLQFVFVVMYFLGNSVTAWLYYMLMPYYFWEFNRINFVLSIILVWASICVGANLIAATPSNAIELIFYLMIPILAGFSVLILERRKTFLKSCSVVQMWSEYDIELQCRFLIEDVTAYMRLRNTEYGLYLNGSAHKFDLGYTYQPLPNYPRSIEEHEKIQAEHEALIEKAEQLYIAGLRRFPVAMMALFRAEFCFCYKKEIASALHTLSKAESFHPIFDELFGVYALRMTYTELDEVNQRDIASYLSWQANQVTARREDEKATLYQLRFWNELSNSTPDLARMHDLSILIHTSMNLAHDAFKQLMKLNPNSEKILRLYASFLIDVLNRSEEALVLLHRADELEESASRLHRENESNTEGLMGDRMAIVTISSALENLGDVIDMNTGVVRLVGHSRADLIGSNVNRLVPNPYSNHHDMYLKRYLETGYSRMMNSNNFVIALHKNGFIVPIEFYMREVSSSQLHSANATEFTGSKDATFIAVIKPSSFLLTAIARWGPVSKEDSSMLASSLKIEFLMVDPTFNVMYCTSSLSALCSVTLDMIRSGYSVISIVKHFDDRLEEFLQAEENGLPASLHAANGLEIPCACRVQSVVVYGSEFYYLVQLIMQPNVMSLKPLNSELHDSANLLLEKKVYEDRKLDAILRVDGFEEEKLDVFSSNFGLDEETRAPLLSWNAGVRPKSGDDHSIVHKSQISGSEKRSAKSNGSSAATMHARLKAFSVNVHSQGLGTGLKNLLAMLLGSLVLVAALAIVKFAVVDSMVSSYTDLLTDTYYSARMRFLCLRMAFNTRVLMLSPKYTGFSGFMTDFEVKSYQTGANSLQADAAEITQWNTYLIVSRGSYLTQEHYSFLINPNVVVYSQTNINGVLTFENSTMSIWDAVKTLVANANNVIAEDLSLVTDTDQPTFFVLQNAIGNLYAALNVSTSMYCTAVTTYVGKMFAVFLSLTLASILAIFLIIMFAIRPAVWVVEDNKQHVLYLFTEIPASVIQSFKLRCERRLLSLQRSREQFEKDGIDDADFDEAVVSDQVAQENEKNASRIERKDSVNSEITFGARHWTLIKISFMLVAVIVYFVVTYWIEFGQIQQQLLSSPNEINWTQYRFTQFLLSLTYLRKLLTQTYVRIATNGSPYINLATTVATSNAIVFMESIQNSLAFGDPTRDVLQPTGAISQLMFTSASCVAVPPNYYPLPDCATFGQGIMNNGLHDAFLSSAVIMNDLLTTIDALNVSNFVAVNTTLWSSKMETLVTLQQTHLQLLSAYTRIVINNQAQETVNALFAARLISLLIFLVVTLIMFVFYFHPLIYSLNDEQKRTIAFLLLIPSEVMEKMPALRSFVEKLASESNMEME